MIYTFNDGLDRIILPEDTLIENDFGTYKLTYRYFEKILFVIREFLLKSGYVPVNKYPDFYSFLNSIKTIENQKIIIRNL